MTYKGMLMTVSTEYTAPEESAGMGDAFSQDNQLIITLGTPFAFS
jgi:hypothetical protein